MRFLPPLLPEIMTTRSPACDGMVEHMQVRVVYIADWSEDACPTRDWELVVGFRSYYRRSITARIVASLLFAMWICEFHVRTLGCDVWRLNLFEYFTCSARGSGHIGCAWEGDSAYTAIWSSNYYNFD